MSSSHEIKSSYTNKKNNALQLCVCTSRWTNRQITTKHVQINKEKIFQRQLQCKNTKILSHLLFMKYFMCLTHPFVIWRYQPEQSFEAYEMANTQEEPEIPESYNVDMLPPPEDRFTIKNLLYPLNTEPSPRSGTAVNICTSVLGEMHKKTREKWIKMSDWTLLLIMIIIWSQPFPPGVMVFVFSVVAVQGGLATWSLCVLGTVLVVCLILTIIVWRQPQSKAKLAFKVECVLSHTLDAHNKHNTRDDCGWTCQRETGQVGHSASKIEN